jgi:hypothetical protein
MTTVKVGSDMFAQLPSNRLGNGERAVSAYAYANRAFLQAWVTG